MNSRENERRLAQIAKEASETVARLGALLPVEVVKRMYDEVVFDLTINTKLANKMKKRPSESPQLSSAYVHDNADQN